MRKETKKERLLQVVRVLEELPPEKKFSLGIWFKCGSVGCAVGWAAADPWFNRRGLRLVGNYSKLPKCRGQFYFEAAQEFFDLTWHQTRYLFSPARYGRCTRKDVIRRIQQFVADDCHMPGETSGT